MISLGSSSTGMVLGFEDLSRGAGICDADYNDVIVAIRGVNIPLI